MHEPKSLILLKDLFEPGFERFRRLVERVPLRDELLLALVAVLMVLPFLGLRSYHFEEALTAALAEDALTGSPWYVPDIFGARWIERPVLHSWIVTLVSLPLGGVSQISARLPTIAANFMGAVLILWLLRPRVSRAAALFGALAFLFSPALLHRAVTAEADILLSVFEFAAFVVWWKGFEAGRLSLLRWTGVGLLLAATALCKGPQPATFFAFGVGAFILVERDWRQIPGYVFAGVVSFGIMLSWYLAVYTESDVQTLLAYMRLSQSGGAWDYLHDRFEFLPILLTFLPGLLVVAAVFWSRLRRQTPDDVADPDRKLFLALALYAVIPIIPLALWPGAQTRYAMPALLAVAAMGGLAIDRLAARRADIAGVAVAILTGLMAFQFALVWIVGPLFPDAFRESRRGAEVVQGVVRTDPRTVYAPLRSADRVLIYLDGPVRYLEPGAEGELTVPSYFLGEQWRADKFAQKRPDVVLVPRAAIDFDSDVLMLYEALPR